MLMFDNYDHRDNDEDVLSKVLPYTWRDYFLISILPMAIALLSFLLCFWLVD